MKSTTKTIERKQTCEKCGEKANHFTTNYKNKKRTGLTIPENFVVKKIDQDTIKLLCQHCGHENELTGDFRKDLFETQLPRFAENDRVASLGKN